MTALFESVLGVVAVLAIGGVAWVAGTWLDQRTPARGRPTRVAVSHVGVSIVVAGVALAAGSVLARALHRAPYPGENGGWIALWWALVYLLAAAITHGRLARARLRDQDAARAAAELSALRARLDPHFLFNTLHAVSAIAASDAAGVQEALGRLATLLRYVLQADRTPVVALREELAFVRAYLELERMRLGGRLVVDERIAREALDVQVPRLLLQPLVENAVRHGVGASATPTCIRIEAALEEDAVAGDRLRLAVVDDGVGGGGTAGTGHGLGVVRALLEARYPGRHRFEAASVAERGYAARIVIEDVDDAA